MTEKDLSTAGAPGADSDDDWEWRRRIRAHSRLYPVYRVLVFILGLAVVILGILLVPLPGPGWLVFLLGLAIWASEFHLAHRLLEFVRAEVRAWTAWTTRQPWWLKVIAGLVTVAFVAGLFWVMFWISGVPRFLPDGLEGWLKEHLGLD